MSAKKKLTERQAASAIYVLLDQAGDERLDAAAFAELEAKIVEIADSSEDPEEVLEVVGEPLAMLHPL